MIKMIGLFVSILIFLSTFYWPNEKPSFHKSIDDTNALVLSKNFTKATLKTSNGCGVGNFLIPVTGDVDQSQPPVLMALSMDTPVGSVILDTIPGSRILGTAFKREGFEQNTSLIEANLEFPYVIISDVGLVSYAIPFDFDPSSTQLDHTAFLPIPEIAKVAKQVTSEFSNPIVLLLNDPEGKYIVSVYSYPDLLEQFKVDLHFLPEIFEVIGNDLFVSGEDTSGNYALLHFGALQDTLYGKYILNRQVADAQEILKIDSEVFILSAPGDTSIILSTINLENGELAQATILENSGVRATHNEFKGSRSFTFQPVSKENEDLNRQILILDPQNIEVDTFRVDLQLDYFKHPIEVSQAFGSYDLSWIGARWEDVSIDSVYFGAYSDLNLKITSNGSVNDVNATYGCWVNVLENELDKIKFEFFPNPTSTEVTVNLTGLVSGKKYKLDVTDGSGRIYHSTNLAAYET